MRKDRILPPDIPVDDSFFEALSALEPDTLKDRTCEIGKDYLSVTALQDDLLYDVRAQKTMRQSEWEQFCRDRLLEQWKKQTQALEKHGLLDAYESLKDYLQNHDRIRQIDGDVSEDGSFLYRLVGRDLSYGYRLTGFQILEDSVIWKVTTYERPVKEKDCTRGLDDCYLMFRDGMTTEVVLKLDYQRLTGENAGSLEDDINCSNQYRSLPL